MQIGRRIIYDSQTGEILLDTGEDTNATEERPVWNGVTYIDIPYGQDSDKYSRVVKYYVDISTKTVVFDELTPVPITTEQQMNMIARTLFSLNLSFTKDNKNAQLVKDILNALKNLTEGSAE